MKKIITFGEILLRLSTRIGVRAVQANELTMHYGGAEANVAVSLANFGHTVRFVSKVPNNQLGHAAERHLRLYGVDTSYVLHGGERLGTYYLESGVGERSAQVVYDRKYSSLSELTEEEIDFDEIFQGVNLFHVSGITPALSPTLQALTLLALQKAKDHGVVTSFDFNYRSKLWNQKEAANAIKPLLPYVDICSCGELDAIHLLEIAEAPNSLNKEMKLQYYYEQIQKMYPNITYMSSTFRQIISASANTLQGNLFADGVLYHSKEHHIEPIVDRVGGGDAFAAGILHGILEGQSLEKTVSFATAASALKHTVHGDCNVFSVDEINGFIENGSGRIIR
ncbi:PfkB family carbohydrate kinase [Sporosarcina beigongshangi]|uniref:PfkB family carbohydrate kinase n=1 Tax=Sporosarcina beigongshangi TaxID=2782538 RepID=UPI0019395B58|nr:sugar kinase [Sporosarcina beigongshangi]